MVPRVGDKLVRDADGTEGRVLHVRGNFKSGYRLSVKVETTTIYVHWHPTKSEWRIVR